MQCPIRLLASDNHRGFKEAVADSGELMELVVEYGFRDKNGNGAEAADFPAFVAHRSAIVPSLRIVPALIVPIKTALWKVLQAGVVVQTRLDDGCGCRPRTLMSLGSAQLQLWVLIQAPRPFSPSSSFD